MVAEHGQRFAVIAWTTSVTRCSSCTVTPLLVNAVRGDRAQRAPASGPVHRSEQGADLGELVLISAPSCSWAHDGSPGVIPSASSSTAAGSEGSPESPTRVQALRGQVVEHEVDDRPGVEALVAGRLGSRGRPLPVVAARGRRGPGGGAAVPGDLDLLEGLQLLRERRRAREHRRLVLGDPRVDQA